jgi:hypothetical protein
MSQPEPLSPEAVDALLSAELDGDLEGAARDLGLSGSEAIAQLGVTLGVDVRRVALRRARDLIATRPAVERALEDQLVAGAMARDDLAAVRERRSRNARRWRVLVTTGSVAAAIAVIVGIASLNTGNGSSSKASSPLTEGASTRAPKPAAGEHDSVTRNRPDLGAVPNADALLAPAEKLLRNSAPVVASPTQSTTKALAPAQPDSATDSTGSESFEAFKGAVPACSAAGVHYSYSIPPALIATGTVSGQRVLILIYEGAGTPYADVIRVSDCKLVRQLLLG